MKKQIIFFILVPLLLHFTNNAITSAEKLKLGILMYRMQKEHAEHEEKNKQLIKLQYCCGALGLIGSGCMFVRARSRSALLPSALMLPVIIFNQVMIHNYKTRQKLLLESVNNLKEVLNPAN